jgi:predicted DNA-binding protein (UPF0251 family)
MKGTALPRPRKKRRCRAFDGDRVFKPRSIPMRQLERVRLELGELEAMRLCDLEGLSQDTAGARIGVSRGTVQRMLKRARAKIVVALLESKALLVEETDGEDSIGDPATTGTAPKRKEGDHGR